MGDKIQLSDRHVYDVLLDLDANQYKEYVRIYDSHRLQLTTLKILPRLEVEVGYINALFELGYYDQVLRYIDMPIEDVIVYNVDSVAGQDVYRKLLFQKSASLMHMGRYHESKEIMSSLIRMSENKDFFRMMYAEILFQQEKKWIQRIHYSVLFLWTFSASVILLELLIIRMFFDSWIEGTVLVRTVAFLVGLVIFIGGYSILKSYSFLKARSIK